MDDHAALLKAQELIHLPAQSADKKGWSVHYCDNGKWKYEEFTLSEDAWNFFYTKLAEVKRQFLNKGNRQRGC